MKSMLKRTVKVVAAVLIFCIMLIWVQNVLAGNSDVRDSKRITGFYEQPEGSLDAVFIGSSTTYAYWMAPYAWQEYGIAVYPYAASSMPVEPMRFIVEECRKTQPDALYIINLTSLYDDRSQQQLSYLFNEMPWNLTKLKAIHYTSKSLGLTFEESLELYFPILRFHDRWYEIGRQDIFPAGNSYKSGNTYNGFFKTKAVTPSIPNEGNIIELPDNLDQTINDLIDYLEKENVRFMFVMVPQSITNQKKFDYQNSVEKLVEGRGYAVLNLHDYIEEMDLSFETDFYNTVHTNHRGSIKVSAFLSEYLIEYYGFTDKRNNPAYADWNEAAEKYYDEVLLPELDESDMAYLPSQMK